MLGAIVLGLFASGYVQLDRCGYRGRHVMLPTGWVLVDGVDTLVLVLIAFMPVQIRMHIDVLLCVVLVW